MSAPTDSTSFDFRYLVKVVKGWLMCSLLCPNIIQSTMCFFDTIAFHTSPSMRHYEVVGKSLRKICHYERNV